MIDISIDGFIKQLATSRAVRVRTHAWWLQNKVLHKSKVQSFFCLLKSWCIHFVSCFTIATQWLQYTYIYIYTYIYMFNSNVYAHIMYISTCSYNVNTIYRWSHMHSICDFCSAPSWQWKQRRDLPAATFSRSKAARNASRKSCVGSALRRGGTEWNGEAAGFRANQCPMDLLNHLSSGYCGGL